MPLLPMPASVSPRCSGYVQRAARLRYTAIKSWTPLTLALITIMSAPKPKLSARFALSSAETTMASRMTSIAASGAACFEFSSIMRVSRS